MAADTTATNSFKNTIIVAYPPGGYGTFVEWCLTYFTGNLPPGPQSWPFIDSTGSAHRFKGNHLRLPQKSFQVERYLVDIETYLNQDTHSVKFARTHAEFKDMQEYIDCYHAKIKKFVYIRPNANTMLLTLNNIVEKAPLNPIAVRSLKHSKPNTDRWEIRESISFWLGEYKDYMTTFCSVTENCVIVELTDLIANLPSSLDKIFTQTGLQWSSPHREDIDAITSKWLSLQKHLNKDVVCQNIVDSVITSAYYDWSDQKLTVYDEAFVQWTLRDLHGLGMRCYNVNVFPTNTNLLKKLLINE